MLTSYNASLIINKYLKSFRDRYDKHCVNTLNIVPTYFKYFFRQKY